MDNELLIYEYMDGNLSDTDESKLFRDLSVDKMLRADFRQQLQINAALHSDISAYVPKASSTLNIFNAIGASTAAVGVAGASSEALVGNITKTSFFAKFSAPIISGLTSAAAAVIAMLILYNPWGETNINSNKARGKYATSQPTMQQPSQTSLLPSNNEVTPQVIYKYIVINNDKSNQNGSDNPIQPQIIYQIPGVNYDNSLSENNITNDFESQETENQNNVVFEDYKAYSYSLPMAEKNRFAIETGFSNYINTDAGALHPKQYQTINNIDIAAYYLLNDEFALGFDYRRENYYQKFSGKEFSNVYQYEQQPNFQIASATVRYSPEFSKFSYFEPFAEVSVGMPVDKISGYVVRPMMLGVNVKPFNGFSLVAGLDYSLMTYYHQNNRFNSGKFGFHFRAGWSF